MIRKERTNKRMRRKNNRVEVDYGKKDDFFLYIKKIVVSKVSRP